MAGPGGHRGPGGPGGPGPRGMGGKPKNTKQTIKRLFGYISADSWKIGIVFLCVILNTGASLVGSYLLRPIINQLGENAEKVKNAGGSTAQAVIAAGTEALLQGLIVMATVYMIGVVCSYLQSRIMISVSQKALQNVRNELFAKMQKLPMRFFDSNNHGELMSRVTNDVDNVSQMLNNSISQIFQSILTIIGTFFMMLYLSIPLTIATVLTVPIIMVVTKWVMTHSRKYFKEKKIK